MRGTSFPAVLPSGTSQRTAHRPNTPRRGLHSVESTELRLRSFGRDRNRLGFGLRNASLFGQVVVVANERNNAAVRRQQASLSRHSPRTVSRAALKSDRLSAAIRSNRIECILLVFLCCALR